MRDWKSLVYTNTFRDLVDLFNANSDSSAYLDSIVGTIMSNGVLFSGKETIEGVNIEPLKPVEISGALVNSDTILDNFQLYYRESNKVISLDLFPVDLLSYADGKLHFFYIREDLSYRVSDYMFGGVDEILLFRFIINTNSTWNQLYIMAQRAGTPIYNAGDEFYDVDGVYVKSPGGLELSHTSGTVRRSGIDFTDKPSPDIYKDYGLATQRVPLRYVNTKNEIDYTQSPVYNIITDRYMSYNQSAKLKTEADEYIRIIQNLYYGIISYSNDVAEELHESIISGGELTYLQQLVNAYTSHIDLIYDQVDNLYNLLGDSALSSVDRSTLLTNKTNIYAYINQYLSSSAISTAVTEAQVTAIRNVPSYIVIDDTTFYNNPLSVVLGVISNELEQIDFAVGTIGNVPSGKFTIQRILWDIYEHSFIMQYGDTVYDTFNDAIAGTALLSYPAPFNKTIYIPLSIMVIKSGISSINSDTETIIINRKWVEVDQEQSDYADYVARSWADKALNQITAILNGDLVVDKANKLKYTNNGTVAYADGDFYLNYNNLRNKISIVNNLNESTYDSTHALSAYQGYTLNQNKLSTTGGTLTGALTAKAITADNITAKNVTPSATNTYNLGDNSHYWNNAYIKTGYITNIHSTTIGTANITTGLYKGSGTSNPYVYSSGGSVVNIQSGTLSWFNSNWSSLTNKTVYVAY